MADKVTLEIDGKKICYSSEVKDIPVMNVGALDTGGFIKCCVVNGLCYIYFSGLYSTWSGSNTWVRVAGPIPTAKLYTDMRLTSGNAVRISDLDGRTYIDIYLNNSTHNNGAFIYPVADSWGEA